jgi:hypothetical protein
MCKQSISAICVTLLLCLGTVVSADIFDGLIGYWPLDEGAGDAVTDASGAGHHGAVASGNPQWVEGMFGLALQFDGSSEVEIPDHADFHVEDAITMALWMKPEADQPDYAKPFIKQKSGEYPYALQFNTAQRIYATVDASTRFNTSPTLENFPGEWAHLCFTYDGEALILYKDGEEAARVVATGALQQNDLSLSIGGRLDSGQDFIGTIDDVILYNRALSPQEVQQLMSGLSDPTVASGPDPAGGKTDVPREVTLSWKPGAFAGTHDVYVGSGFAEVSDADRANGGNVLKSQGQTAIAYTVDSLAFEQTYYWRVDEVNAAPDNTIFKGDIWSFTVEPEAVVVENVTATASGANLNMGPENTVNGSGLNEQDQHSTTPSDMWLTITDGSWIQYEFDRVYKLHEMWVWNSNQAIEGFIGFGVKEVTAEYSVDGENWVALDSVTTLARATGLDTYGGNAAIDMAGIMAKFVKLSPVSAYGLTGQSGLSELRFTAIPVAAREPQPADGATTGAADVRMSWRSGREAVSHEVALSTDLETMTNGTAPVNTVSDRSYDAGILDLGKQYFWQVTEVNDAAVPAAHVSELWSFTIPPYEIFEGFEAYSGEEGAEVFMAWWDSFGGDATLGGSTTGYIDAPFVETSIVNPGMGGGQSLPMIYDNDGGFVDIDGQVSSPRFSEVVREFDGLDLTKGNAEVLAVSFRGNAAGFVENVDGSITMSGAGADIWNTADQFRFAYKTLSGNGSITAKVNSALDMNQWTKVGVMIRETTAADSVNAFSFVTPQGRVGTQWRQFSGDDTTSTRSDDNGDISLPFWVRLTRTGNTFKGERSADGVTWEPVFRISVPADPAEKDITMANNVLIGLAVTSHSTGDTTVADFSEISTTGNVTGAWQAEVIGDEPMPSNEGQDPLYLIVEDSAGQSVTITHPDAAAIQASTWQDWLIPVADFSSLRENNIKAITIGVGYKNGAQAGSEGILYIDDLRIGTP